MSERIVGVTPKEYNGKLYRSTLEAKTAETLDELGVEYSYENRKLILQEGFRCPYQKDKVRDLTYTPDFEVGNVILECKGFETPEWKIKKKLVFKYLMDNEPETSFYQIHDNKKELLRALDSHWRDLGYCIQVSSKPVTTKRKHVDVSIWLFDSIIEAMNELHIGYKPIGNIMKSLTGEKDYIYGYKWTLIKI